MADYISREAVVAELNAEGYTKNMRIHKRILAIPPADVRPVVYGKWFAYQQERWVYAKCSECETVQDAKSNFCPNCGADMREVKVDG